jgi:protein SCO1/2
MRREHRCDVARTPRRNILSILAFASVPLVIGAILVIRAGGGEPRLIGTDLNRLPAPDFTLIDQRGQTVRLSDFRGKAVVLTFIYTHCPDVCPLIAENLRVVNELLPAEGRDDVVFLAVTIDPTRDTQASLQEFSERHRVADNSNWHALRGDLATLEQVWRSYGIYPGASPASPAHDRAIREAGKPSPEGGIGHTDAIYLIDAEGRERVFLRSNVDPATLAENLATLMR